LPDLLSSLTLAYVRRRSRCVKLISFSIAILWWTPAVSKQQTSPPLMLFMHGCSHYQGSTVFPRLYVGGRMWRGSACVVRFSSVRAGTNLCSY